MSGSKKRSQPVSRLAIKDKKGKTRYYKIDGMLHADAAGLQGSVRKLIEVTKWGQPIAPASDSKSLLVKIIPLQDKQGMLSLEEVRQNIENEYVALKRLHDVECIIEGDYAYLIMPKLADKDLFQILKIPTVTFAQKAVMMSQATAQVMRMQVPKSPDDETIIHRDLKPENVVVAKIDSPHSYPATYIIDPGLSIRVKGGEIKGLTRLSIGTSGFRPCEYVRQNKQDASFDVFSLGVMAVDLLVRQINDVLMKEIEEAEGTSILALLDRRVFTNVSSDPLTVEIVAFIRTMLADEPQQRPSIEKVVRFFNVVSQIALIDDIVQQGLQLKEKSVYAGRDFSNERENKLSQLRALNAVPVAISVATATTPESTPAAIPKPDRQRLFSGVFAPPPAVVAEYEQARMLRIAQENPLPHSCREEAANLVNPENTVERRLSIT